MGPKYNNSDIEKELKSRNVSYKKFDDDAELISEIVDDLVVGRVIGFYQVRSEWGPGALGGRSILAHPGFPGMKGFLQTKMDTIAIENFLVRKS
ncbi:MAG: hypothetical protein GY730_10855 [bacterium]|nr:hypothetical protein [bacterium]